ncbi:MAG: hypothetical protein ACREGF_03355, partial [Candidatus Saccharimonadales bacterium]
KKAAIAVIAAVVIIGGAVIASVSLEHKPQPTGTTPTTNIKKSSQVLPVGTNPIHNTSTKTGVSIVAAMVENNTDPATGKPIADRLQFSIKNSSSQLINNLEVYYTMTDAKTHQSENYYQKLGGLSVAPGQTKTVFFDNGSAPGHYPENKYSIYRTSPHAVDFTIEVSELGFQPATAHAKKDPGTGEQKNG